jgi:propanol-preferring alcohol dehydrogenase
MRAARLHSFHSPLQSHTQPDPVPGADEVLVAVRAAGICHSDVHYRAGRSSVALPLILGHEVAGEVIARGSAVHDVAVGDRVAIHYLLSCGVCHRCVRFGEQFCERGAMIGKERDGGYADRIVVPARNAVRIPDNVAFEQAAIMMCSTATAYHALRLAELKPSDSIAILGFGGLGVSAVQLARAHGVETVVAVDVVPEKLRRAEDLGAIAIRPDQLQEYAIDVALDFAGHPDTTTAAVRALNPGGRLMVVAISLPRLDCDPYRDLLARERRIIGCSDHLREELVELLDMVSDGDFDLSQAITRTVPLDAKEINAVLDDIEHGTTHLRSVILP